MSEPRFQRGQLVRHTRHPYRGVVLEVRLAGNPDDSWGNPSGDIADEERAWYKVLVHGAQHSTLIPEHELAPDEGGEQVIHPRINDYFEGFADGRYKPRIL